MTEIPRQTIAQARETVIQPRKGIGPLDLDELWTHRELIYFFVWRDFKVRYRQTVLGVAWAVIQPVLTAAVFTMLFYYVAGLSSEGVPYPLFVLAGLVSWQFFTHGVTTSAMGLVANQDLVRRVYFPRLALPLANVLSGLVDLLVGLVLLMGALIFYGWDPSAGLLLVPVFLMLGMVATLGIGLILCAANILYRDIGHILPFALQIALFASPLGYSSSVLPDHWRLVYSLNPMVGVIDGLRWSLFGTPVDPLSMFVSAVAAGAALVIGVIYFRHVERVLADIL